MYSSAYSGFSVRVIFQLNSCSSGPDLMNLLLTVDMDGVTMSRLPINDNLQIEVFRKNRLTELFSRFNPANVNDPPEAMISVFAANPHIYKSHNIPRFLQH